MNTEKPKVQIETDLMPKPVWREEILAALLALVSGYVDAYAYLIYKLYVSFMSGNTTQTGLPLGEWKLQTAWHNMFPILAFVVGVFAGTLLLHSRLRHPVRWLFGAVAALLAGSVAAAYFGALPGWFNILLLGAAMGAVNISVARVGAQSVGLGYITGSLNNLAQHVALAIKKLPLPQAKGAWDTHWRRASLLAGIWIAFLLGALLGGATTSRFAMWTLLPPILVLVVLATFDYEATDES